jgi:hypothetical protein
MGRNKLLKVAGTNMWRPTNLLDLYVQAPLVLHTETPIVGFASDLWGSVYGADVNVPRAWESKLNME